MASNTIKGLTVEIGGDTTKLGKALENVNKKSKDLSMELGRINGLLKMDPGNTDLLAQKQKVLSEAIANTAEKLDTLRDAEKQVQKQFERGEVSEEQVRALQREIIATTKKLDSYKTALDKTEKSLTGMGDESEDLEDSSKKVQKGTDKASKALDDYSDKADKAEKSSGKLSKVGSAVGKGMAAVGAAVAAAGAALIASAEASREYRTEMGKLDAAFTTSGHSSEAATKTYKALQGVLGETDQAVEAANHLAKLTDNEQDLQKWTDICTGVYATFGASLPIEGLTEAANETAKVGKVTGPLADALNWAGVSEDEFNTSLAACSNEQERQTLIMETLNGLYDDAANKYKETNAEVIRANQANEEWAASMAEVGGAVEPLLTDIKLLGASLLSDLVPGVKEVTGAFRAMLSGDEEGAANLGEALSGLISQLLTKITELLPQVAQMGVSLVTSLVTSIIMALPQLLDTGVQVVVALLNGLTTAIPQVIAAASAVLPHLVQALVNGIPLIIQAGVDLLLALVQAIPQIIPPLTDAIVPIVMAVIDGLLSAIPQLIQGAVTFLLAIIQAIPIICQKLIPQIGPIITTIVNGLIENIPVLLDGALQLLNAIIQAIPILLQALIPQIPSIVNTVVTQLLRMSPVLINAAVKLFMALVKAIPTVVGQLVRNLPMILNAVTDVLGQLPKLLLGIGKDMIRGLWNGIKDMTGWITGKLEGFGDSVLGGIKKFFGIKSPSRVFKDEVGKMLAVGMADGIEDNSDAPLDAMSHLSNDLLNEAQGLDGLAIERQINHSYRAEAAAAAMQSTDMLGKLDQILEAIKRGQILTINGDTLVGATANAMNSALGQRRVLAERGAV